MNRSTTKFILKILIAALLIFIIVGYALFRAYDLLRGPEIVVNEPLNGEIVSSSVLEIKGTTFDIKDLRIDDRPITVNEKGDFDDTFILAPGYNAIEIKGLDRFNRTSRQVFEIIYRL